MLVVDIFEIKLNEASERYSFLEIDLKDRRILVETIQLFVEVTRDLK